MRSYSFCVVSYNTSVSDILELLNRASHYIYILHDHDDTDPHLHICLTTKQPASFNTIRNCVKGDQNVFVEELRDKTAMANYLCHEGSQDKYVYPRSALQSNDLSFWFKDVETKDSDFVTDLLECSLSYREMAIKYGRDYMRNFSAYQNFAYQVRLQEKTINIKNKSPFD